MSRYRKVHVKIWNDEKFRQFTDDGKLAFLFLLTHPAMTSLGAMRATAGGLADEMGWEIERMRSALNEPLLQNMVVINRMAAFVWVPKFLAHNEPESPNVVRSWAAQFEMIPECAEKKGVIETAERVCQSLGEGFAKAFKEAFPKGSPHASPNPEPKPLPEPLPQPLTSKALGTEVPIPPATKFQKPTLQQVIAYIKEKNFKVDPEKWYDYYTSNGWKVGRNSMKDWQAAVRTWAKGSGFSGDRRQVPAAPVIPNGRDVIKRLESL